METTVVRLSVPDVTRDYHVNDLHARSSEDLISQTQELRLATRAIQEETFTFCAFLIRLHEVRQSIDLKIHPRLPHHAGSHQIPNLTSIVRDLYSNRAKYLAQYHHARENEGNENESFSLHTHRPLVLTDAQKTSVATQQIQHLQRHFKSVQQEMLAVHDQFEAKVSDADIFRTFIHRQSGDLARRKLDFEGSNRINTPCSEKVLMWLKHELWTVENLIQAANLNRSQNCRDMRIMRLSLDQPMESSTRVDYETMEIECQETIMALESHTQTFNQVKRQFNAITHKYAELLDSLAVLQKRLPEMAESVQKKDQLSAQIGDNTAERYEEAKILAEHNNRLAVARRALLYPTINCYVKIEQDIEKCRAELKLWASKSKLAETLQLLSTRSSRRLTTAATSIMRDRHCAPGSFRPSTSIGSKRVLMGQS